MKAKLWHPDWKQQLGHDLEILHSAVQTVHLSERRHGTSGRITIPSLEVASSTIILLNRIADCAQKFRAEANLAQVRIIDSSLLRMPQKIEPSVLDVVKKVAKNTSILKALTDESVRWLVCSGALYSAPSILGTDEAKTFVQNAHRKYQMDRDRLLQGDSLSRRRRTQIPEAVRNEVWRRDEGQCVECGSIENLEYDHLVPFSRGGSNTARNLRLLCERCNRTKGDSI